MDISSLDTHMNPAKWLPLFFPFVLMKKLRHGVVNLLSM